MGNVSARVGDEYVGWCDGLVERQMRECVMECYVYPVACVSEVVRFSMEANVMSFRKMANCTHVSQTPQLG